MVRGAGMSRGCANCRQRKVKCDESQPECARCLKSGKKCPGSVLGLVFLAFNGRGSTKSKRIEHDCRDTRQIYQPLIKRDSTTTLQQISSTSALPSDIHTPDPSDLLETQLRASFISFFIRSGPNKSRSQSWLESSILRTENMSIPGWRESVLAATLALYGTSEQNPGAIAAAYKWYNHALCYQRQNLRLFIENPSVQVNEMHVSMAVILAYSEVVLPSHTRAFSQHIKAAATLLQIVGPEACMHDNLHQIFLTIRLYMVYESFGERKVSIFASNDWIDVPFQNREKSSLDLVIDLLLQIPGASPRMAATLLEGLWRQLVQSNPDLISSPRHIMLKQVLGFRDLWDCVPDRFRHSSSEAAIALALYNFGWITSLSLLKQCGDHAAEYAELIDSHCGTILDAAAFVSTIEDGCSYIRLTPPLRSVLQYSSNQGQRKSALLFMRAWGKSINLLQLSTGPFGQNWQFHDSD